MGLDVTVYRGLRVAENQTFDADGCPLEDGDCVTFYVNHDFPGREAPIQERTVYVYDDSADGGTWGYMGYGHLRNELAKLAGYPEGAVTMHGSEHKTHCAACWGGEVGPFSELINFSDCEGIIGSECATKLAADFATFQEKAAVHDSERFRSFYTQWRKNCEYAANAGAIKFF